MISKIIFWSVIVIIGLAAFISLILVIAIGIYAYNGGVIEIKYDREDGQE